MKSRAIALGASAIVLTLASGGQAVAGGLEDLGQGLKAQTETSVRAPGSASAEVEGNLRVPVKVPSKDAVKDIKKAARKAARKAALPAGPTATIEAQQRSGKDSSEVVLDLNRHGASAYVDQRRKGEFELELEGEASPRRAESSVTGFSRQAGKVTANGRGHGPKVKHSGLDSSIRKHARRAAPSGVSQTRGGGEKLNPLQMIGREVGHPVQLILGGWLIPLSACGGFAATRLVRRLQRTS